MKHGILRNGQLGIVKLFIGWIYRSFRSLLLGASVVSRKSPRQRAIIYYEATSEAKTCPSITLYPLEKSPADRHAMRVSRLTAGCTLSKECSHCNAPPNELALFCSACMCMPHAGMDWSKYRYRAYTRVDWCTGCSNKASSLQEEGHMKRNLFDLLMLFQYLSFVLCDSGFPIL